jgi:hypothetical protein
LVIAFEADAFEVERPVTNLPYFATDSTSLASISIATNGSSASFSSTSSALRKRGPAGCRAPGWLEPATARAGEDVSVPQGRVHGSGREAAKRD